MPLHIAVALRSGNAAELRKAEGYMDWLRCGGAEPVAVALPQGRLASSAAGLLLTGGEDVDPNLYGEPNLHAWRTNRRRDELELVLVAEARQRELPILGVCRGAQVLAVALGGTLVQDIPRELPGAAVSHHSGEPAADVEQTIGIWIGERSVPPARTARPSGAQNARSRRSSHSAAGRRDFEVASRLSPTAMAAASR